MKRDQLLETIKSRAALPTIDDARASAEAVLEAVGERLSPVSAEAVARELPSVLGSALLRGATRDYDLSIDELFRRVASARRAPLSEAVEETVTVCRVVSDALTDDARAHVTKNQPEAWRKLFEIVKPAHTAPGLAHDRFAQPGSIARDVHPHAADKLSSGHPEPIGDPIAMGRPGSETPLSEGGQEERRP